MSSNISNVLNRLIGGNDNISANEISSNKPQNLSSQTAKLSPQNDIWANNLTSQISQTQIAPPKISEPETTFSVKLPVSKNAHDVRDNLLRDSFNFDKDDIAAFNKADDLKTGDNKFVIFDDKSFEQTGKEV